MDALLWVGLTTSVFGEVGLRWIRFEAGARTGSARRPEQGPESAAHRGRAREVAKHVAPFVQRDPERVVAGNATHQTVAERLVLRRVGKGAEDPIEDDQDAAMVLVETGLVRGMGH